MRWGQRAARGDLHCFLREPISASPENLVDDVVGTFRLQAGDTVFHLLQPFRRVALPLCHFSKHPQRIAGAIGQRRIAGKFLSVTFGSAMVGSTT